MTQLPAIVDEATLTVGILLFDEVEALDFCGPFEVFSVATRAAQRRPGATAPPFRVLTIAERARPIAARGGLLVQPGATFADHAPLDVAIVPGGVVTRELENPAVAAWLRRVSSPALLTASVCTGAFLLAQAGLLEGRQATTHWEDIDAFEARYPQVVVRRAVPWVDEGAVVTSAGISAGIDMSLHLVERQRGRDLARATARQMEYSWDG